MNKVKTSGELEDNHEGGETENRTGTELKHLTTEKRPERNAEMVNNIAKSIIFQLMAVVDGVDVITVANVFVGGGAEQSPGQREEADEIVIGEEGDGEKDPADAELQEHGEIIALWGEIFEREDADKIRGKADDEEIIRRYTSGETEGIGKHEHFQSNSGVIGDAG